MANNEILSILEDYLNENTKRYDYGVIGAITDYILHLTESISEFSFKVDANNFVASLTYTEGPIKHQISFPLDEEV